MLKIFPRITHFLPKIKYNCSTCLHDMDNYCSNEAADPRGSAVELANHRAVREYRRKISSQRKGPFFGHIWV